MSLTYRRAFLKDVQGVLDQVSDVTRAEMRTCGMTKPDLLWLARSHWLHYGEAYAFEENSTVVAVFGFHPNLSDPSVVSTWLISTPRFHTARWTLWGRKFLRHIQEKRPTQRMLTTTWSKHPKVNRWFQLLGFRMLSKTQDAKVFEYDADFCASTSGNETAILGPGRTGSRHPNS